MFRSRAVAKVNPSYSCSTELILGIGNGLLATSLSGIMSRNIGRRRERTSVYSTIKKKSRHNSPTPWEFPPPDTSWPLTPRRHYLSSIRLLQPHRDIPRDNPTTSFDPISGGLGERWILLHCDFCYKKSTQRLEWREWNLLKVDSFFNANSII